MQGDKKAATMIRMPPVHKGPSLNARSIGNGYKRAINAYLKDEWGKA